MRKENPTIENIKDLLHLFYDELAAPCGWKGNTLAAYREHPLSEHPDLLPGMWKSLKARAADLAEAAAILIPLVEAHLDQQARIQEDFKKYRASFRPLEKLNEGGEDAV